jgi:type I restriction enzyme S subunit
MKYLFREVDERFMGDDDRLPLLSVSIHRGVLPRTDLTDREPRADDLVGYKMVRRGDVVINRMRAFEGGAGTSEYDGLVSADYAVLRMTGELDCRYFHHLLRSSWFVGEMTSWLRGIGNSELGNVRTPRINVEDLGSIVIRLPPSRSQATIANYLDTETARIDGLISSRRAQTGLQMARWTEHVRRAFAGGGSVSCRIPWLPPLADDWPIVHLRWLISCLDGRRIPVNREDRAEMMGDIPYWGANGVVDHVDRALFHEPLVLLGEDGAPFLEASQPKAFFVDEPIWVNNHIHVLRAIGVRPRYLASYLNLVDYADFIEGSTRDKLTQDDMGRIPVPVPGEGEQRRIEEIADRARRTSDRTAATLDRQVALLQERRQALITAAVTGQIDIPGVAA